jgi:TolA-binding protein
MKKVLAVLLVTLLLVLIPGVALAADPTDSPVTIYLDVSGGGAVNTNVNLTGSAVNTNVNLSGSTVNANVNGSTLANLHDVQNMGNSLYGNIAGTAADLQNAKVALTSLIYQVKTYEDTTNQGQNQTINLYGDAITKLITDLSNLKNTQALDSYSANSNIQDLQAQFDSINGDIATLNGEMTSNQATDMEGITSLTAYVEQLETSFNNLTGDTKTNYQVLADALNSANQSITTQKIKADQATKIAIIASVVALFSLILTVIGMTKRPHENKVKDPKIIEETEENHAYSGK